jgi:ribonuclease HII
MCGIDENGLGPYLGPLIITSVETQENKNDRKEENIREKSFINGENFTKNRKDTENRGKIKDSKAIFSRRKEDYEKIEKIFFSIFGKSEEINSDEIPPNTIFEVFAKSEFSKEIIEMCPISPEKICFSKITIPLWMKNENSTQNESKKEEIKSNQKGNEIKQEEGEEIASRKLKVRYAILCPGLLSKYIKIMGSKFSVNSYFMVKMALLSSSEKVICGKSGFKKSYKNEIERALQDLKINYRKIKTEKEENEESIYEILEEREGKERTLKKIYFIKDADEKFHEVALASQIGKYIREICMLSLTKFLDEKSTFPISGYGKKENMKKIAESIIQMAYSQKIKIPQECIERNY